ncbi:MAG: hypothetical protein MUC35_03885 [Candidatus Margulisbacteria bacterium]|nr:hypothetical protein [Candidatus Margulisiibacteriota bacterium]
MLLIAGSASATPVQNPYPVTFWINGDLDAGDTGLSGDSLSGFEVYFFKDLGTYQDHYAMSLSVINGRFAVNALDDMGLKLEAGDYYLATKPQDFGGKSYGADPTLLQITPAHTSEGYINLPAGFLRLKEGGGLGVAVVATGLTIARSTTDPADLIVTWDKAIYSNPTIYAMTGDGSGQYDNDYDAAKWLKIFENGTVLITDFGGGKVQYTAGGNSMTHTGQIAAGSNEVYYKTLVNGADPAAAFGAAPAVGKLNIHLGAGMNVASVPFENAATGIDKIFSADLLTNGDNLYFKPLSDRANTDKSTVKDGAWSNPAINIRSNYGYWLETSAAKVMTVWGGVNQEGAYAQTTLIKDAGILVIGCIYPKAALFTDSGLNKAGGAKSGDAVYYKPLAGSPNTQKVLFSESGDQWSDPVIDRTFRLPFGYWYERKSGNGNLDLGRKRPW